MAKTTKTRRKPAVKTAQRKLTDREYLDASLYWPRWPMLPVVKRAGRELDGHGHDGCGFLFSHSREPEPIVYLGNVFRIGEIADAIQAETGRDSCTWQEILATMERVEFPSLEAVLEAYRID
jgi:hypothetical protein